MLITDHFFYTCHNHTVAVSWVLVLHLTIWLSNRNKDGDWYCFVWTEGRLGKWQSPLPPQGEPLHPAPQGFSKGEIPLCGQIKTRSNRYNLTRSCISRYQVNKKLQRTIQCDIELKDQYILKDDRIKGDAATIHNCHLCGQTISPLGIM